LGPTTRGRYKQTCNEGDVSERDGEPDDPQGRWFSEINKKVQVSLSDTPIYLLPTTWLSLCRCMSGQLRGKSALLIYCFSWTIFTFLEAKQRSARRLLSSVTSTTWARPVRTSLPLKVFSFFNRRTALAYFWCGDVKIVSISTARGFTISSAFWTERIHNYLMSTDGFSAIPNCVGRQVHPHDLVVGHLQHCTLVSDPSGGGSSLD